MTIAHPSFWKALEADDCPDEAEEQENQTSVLYEAVMKAYEKNYPKVNVENAPKKKGNLHACVKKPIVKNDEANGADDDVKVPLNHT